MQLYLFATSILEPWQHVPSALHRRITFMNHAARLASLYHPVVLPLCFCASLSVRFPLLKDCVLVQHTHHALILPCGCSLSLRR